ncbi:Crp/Fnr family transcriptional regulator [Chitinophaga japonensis]|uniref:CRP/FNR family transcriptional regulator n=1 Tax=Chitinophaga japonensis TaxID=104662 RepID=A0A562T6C1_CHIJA|nr:Crp/Fnr family transcriptional regulator [Chitinophaga japonensis]TWI89042.1 CRP/FNR family transcriptional regulator [Chitinophaga japonensis]
MKALIQQHFPSFEPALVEELASAGQLRQFPAGEILMKTGQYFRSTMLIVEGLVKVYREDEEGNEFFMYHLQPGQACALSMICAVKHEASEIMAKTVADTTVISIPLEHMDAWMTRYKSWYYFVLESYRNRLEEMLLTIDQIAFRNMDERIVFYLKQHQQTLQTNKIPISFTQIAQELNSSREVISRLMKKLSDKGLVRLHKQYIEIVDLDKLLT